MFAQCSLGLDIRPGGLKAVALRRQGGKIALLGARSQPLPAGVLAAALQRPTVLDPDRFVEAVRSVLTPLAQKDTRLALAVPDTAGHVFLRGVELPFKSRSHALKLLQWQLRELYPQDLERMDIDYQLLGKRGADGQQVLVSVMDRQLLRQYETLLQTAGFQVAQVDFHAMQLYSCYRSRVDLGDDYLLLGLHDGQLSLLAFLGGVLSFYRVKGVEPQPERVFHEINRSLSMYRQQHPDFSQCRVYFHADSAEPAMVEAVQACFEQGVQPLSSQLAPMVESSEPAITPAQMTALAAAIGAAERML